jgi:hypothetical protein
MSAYPFSIPRPDCPKWPIAVIPDRSLDETAWRAGFAAMTTRRLISHNVSIAEPPGGLAASQIEYVRHVGLTGFLAMPQRQSPKLAMIAGITTVLEPASTERASIWPSAQ